MSYEPSYSEIIIEKLDCMIYELKEFELTKDQYRDIIRNLILIDHIINEED